MWDERCPPDAEFVEFTPELQQITLDAHNKLRNQVAMGQLSRYPTASRMATMVTTLMIQNLLFHTQKNSLVFLKTWDDELAELAKYNTMQCHMDHDQCHSTRLFWLSGQSLSVNYNIEDADMAAFAPNNWFSENSAMSVDNIANFQHLKENG